MSDDNRQVWPWILSHAETISYLATSTGVIATALYGFLQLRNYANEKAREIRWRQAQAASEATAEIMDTDEYRILSEVFDIDRSRFIYRNVDFVVQHQDISIYFRTTNMTLSQEEIQIRNCLDRYAQSLSRVEIGLQNDLFLFAQIKSILAYDMMRIQRFPAILAYLEFFKLDEAASFVRRFT